MYKSNIAMGSADPLRQSKEGRSGGGGLDNRLIAISCLGDSSAVDTLRSAKASDQRNYVWPTPTSSGWEGEVRVGCIRLQKSNFGEERERSESPLP